MSLNYPGSRQEKLDLLAKATAKLAEKVEAKKYEDRLLDFAGYVWPVVEPAIPFERGWVLEAICDHLQAVTEGHIRRLLINVPPGFTKSLMTDVFWPAWEWGPRNMPHLRYVCASYSNHLTERDNMRCRNIVTSDRYQRLWANRFAISNEQFTKVKFANDKTGWKLATSVGGIGVGERGDRFIIDDPNNTMEMESEVTRYTTNMWFTEVVPDRLNSQQRSAIVVIQQRLHEEDISGIALERDMGYVHLCIPMEYVPGAYVNGFSGNEIKTYLGDEADEVADDDVFWADPRIEDGELAWPGRFPLKIVEELKRDKGPYAYAGQYMQSPEIRGGSIIKYDYWQKWEKKEYPDLEYILASLDSAYTANEENDPSALTIYGMFRDGMGNPKIILLYAWAERLEFHELVQKVIDTCTKDKRQIKDKCQIDVPRFQVDRLLIEAKASGISVSQELHRMIGLGGQFGIELINPQKQGDKVARAHAVEHVFSSGMVYAPYSPPAGYDWVNKVINQCAAFPKGAHDDLVDSTTMALRYLRDTGFALRREEYSLDVEEEVRYRPKMQPLYPV